MQLAAGAELDELGSFIDDRRVSPGYVKRVAGLEHFVVVGEAVGDLALEHVSPMWARTAVVGQSLEERRGIDRLPEGDEVHRVVVEVLVPVLDRPVILDVRSARPRNSRHLTRLLDSTTASVGSSGVNAHEAFNPSLRER